VRTYPSIVLLQDRQVNKAHDPFFNSFVSFFPPVRKHRVAPYIDRSFLFQYSVLPMFKGEDDGVAPDVSSHQWLFDPDFHSFRIINAY